MIKCVLTKTNEMKIYPNPANDRITIENPYSQTFTLKIFDLMGKVVKYDIIPSDKKQIDVQDLCNGVYILEFSSAEKNMQDKLIIRR